MRVELVIEGGRVLQFADVKAVRVLGAGEDSLAESGAVLHTEDMSRQRVASPAVSDAIERYALWCVAHHRAERYTDQIRAVLRRVAKACEWAVLRDVANGTRDFDDYLTEMPASAKTRNNVLSVVRAWAEWLRKREEITANPFGAIDYSRHFAGGGSRALSPQEMEAMITVAEKDEALPEGERRSTFVRSPWYRLARATGLRALEMVRLRVSNVRLEPVDQARITIPAPVAKARKTQTIPLAEAFVPWLRHYIGSRDPLDSLMASARPRAWVMEGDARAAGISRKNETIGMHSFRKGFVTALAASGAPMSITQGLARHTDPKLTHQVYVDLSMLPLRKALNALAETGYEKSGKSSVDGSPEADRLSQSRSESMNNSSLTQNLSDARAGSPGGSPPALTADGSDGLSALGCSGQNSCGGISAETGQKWAIQGSNLLRSIVAVLAAASDLIRAIASQGGGCDAVSGHDRCGQCRAGYHQGESGVLGGAAGPAD